MATTPLMSLIIAAGFLLPHAAPAAAQAPPTYGLDFVTIGAPGNRPTLPHEVPFSTSWSMGQVDYEYRIMRSKLSNSDYLEFVQAYAPYWNEDPRDPRLIGRWITASPSPTGWNFQMVPGSEQFASSIDWEMAARYCNWLHNGKVTEQWAFESGAYDTSTFVWGPGGGFGWQHQTTRSPGARFWIPSLDEWVKAVYYDPNRYGAGQEGYWINPNSSDDALIVGWPHEGGETIGWLQTLQPGYPGSGAWDLAQYPHVQTPWGLIDVSGTMPDYTEAVYGAGMILVGGSRAGGPADPFDRMDVLSLGHLLEGWNSLRIATVVPSPGSGAVMLLITLTLCRRRRFPPTISNPAPSDERIQS